MRRGGGVLGTNKVYFLIEEQHAGGYIFGMERHPNDGFVPDSKDEAHGGILNSELPPSPRPLLLPTAASSLTPRTRSIGGVPDSELPPDTGFTLDFEDKEVVASPTPSCLTWKIKP